MCVDYDTITDTHTFLFFDNDYNDYNDYDDCNRHSKEERILMQQQFRSNTETNIASGSGSISSSSGGGGRARKHSIFQAYSGKPIPQLPHHILQEVNRLDTITENFNSKLHLVAALSSGSEYLNTPMAGNLAVQLDAMQRSIRMLEITEDELDGSGSNSSGGSGRRKTLRNTIGGMDNRRGSNITTTAISPPPLTTTGEDNNTSRSSTTTTTTDLITTTPIAMNAENETIEYIKQLRKNIRDEVFSMCGVFHSIDISLLQSAVDASSSMRSSLRSKRSDELLQSARTVLRVR